MGWVRGEIAEPMELSHKERENNEYNSNTTP